jgi:hypothetical protein
MLCTYVSCVCLSVMFDECIYFMTCKCALSNHGVLRICCAHADSSRILRSSAQTVTCQLTHDRRHNHTRISCQVAILKPRIRPQATGFLPAKTPTMLLNTQNSHDTPPHHPRSLIFLLTITLSITLATISLATLCILSLLRPTLILSLTTSLTPIFIFTTKTTIYLLLLYLIYSLLQTLHLCLYMMKRQNEWHRAQEQIFGHAKMCFAGEW